MDVEDELDFEEDEPVKLEEYDQYFEWDETEYKKLRFMAARHYASCGHWDDAHAYILRSCPGELVQHQHTYDRNSEVWQCMNTQLNELIQEAEQMLDSRERYVIWGLQVRPSKDTLIPPGHTRGSPFSRKRGGQKPTGTTKAGKEAPFCFTSLFPP